MEPTRKHYNAAEAIYEEGCFQSSHSHIEVNYDSEAAAHILARHFPQPEPEGGAEELSLEARAELAVMRSCGHNDYDRQNNYAAMNPSIRKDRVACVLEQLRAARAAGAREERWRCVASVEAEPELPGMMPDEMLAVLKQHGVNVENKERAAMVFRLFVRLTKQGILKRLSPGRLPEADAFHAKLIADNERLRGELADHRNRDPSYAVRCENNKLARERAAAQKRAEALEGLLREWLAAPFFETRADWSTWVHEFRPRVLAALEESPDEA